MNIFISGSNGFIGKNLKIFFKEKGFSVYSINREYFNLNVHDFANIIYNADVIINLSGFPIYKPWTKKNFKKILASRINTNIKFYEALKIINNKNIIYFTASAIGIYDNIHIHNEDSSLYSNDELSDIICKWEDAAKKIQTCVNNFYIFRLGIVIAKNNGFLENILKFSGLYIFPFSINNPCLSIIHIDDVVQIFYYIISKKPESYIYNVVCTKWISIRDFLKLIKNYKPFLIIPLPQFFFKFIFGRRHILFTKGQKVISKNLNTFNYHYKFSLPVDIIKEVFK